MTHPAETLKMFREAHEEDLMPGIEEDKITTSEPEEKMPVQEIPDEVESVRSNGNDEKPSEFNYHNKYADTDKYLYNRAQDTLKKIDTLYKPMMQNMHNLVIEGNYKVTGDTRVISTMGHKDDWIQWMCSMTIYTDTR